ncbi:MAG: hypothetical protein M3O68_07900 [Thermoproteota archaeon]|nr:hypothetical protein [Thermoproteota archaeon]
MSTDDDNEKIIEGILRTIESLSKKLESNIMAFILDFFKRSHDKKHFDSIISHFINIVLPIYEVASVEELLLVFLGLKNCVNWILADKESFWNALNGLDILDRKIILFQFKTEIENYYLQKYLTEGWKLTRVLSQEAANHNIKLSEDSAKHMVYPGTFWLNTRIERGNDYENVIIPSICEKCNSSSAFAVKVISYLESVVVATGPYPSRVISGNCVKCEAKYSVGTHIMKFPWYNSPWT